MHGRTGHKSGLDGLVARDDAVAMPDRQHRPIDDDAREVHDAVVGRTDRGAGRRDVDAAVPRGVGGGGGDERANYRPGRGHGPGPAVSHDGGTAPRAATSGDRDNPHGEKEDGETHPTMVVGGVRTRLAFETPVESRPMRRPVGERRDAIVLGAPCVNTATTRARCDSRVAQRHPLSPSRRAVEPARRCAGCVPGTRFAADRPR
jgi:hypothetical protein